MPDNISTNSLFRRIMKADRLDVFLEQNAQYLESEDFRAHLERLCSERGEIPERVIMRSQIERSYGHQLFNGTRRPSREKVLQLAFGFGLSVEETQNLLQAAGKGALCPRFRRDAAIIFCLQKRMSLIDTQDVLSANGLAILGDRKKKEED